MNRARVGCSPRLKAHLQAILISSALSSAVFSSARAQEALEDYQCRNDDDIRRIEIRFEDEANQLPCRVIYRPETENQSVGTVSWRGIETLESCQSQARQVVDRLIAEGWDCAILSEPPEHASPELIEAAVDAEEARPDAEDTEQISDDQKLPEEAEPAAVLIENPSLDAPPIELASLIEQDLNKLDTTLDGALQAQIVAYSDLNADDVTDALVLFTYDSPQPAYRQFLAAYLFDGDIYQLTATKPVASSSMDTKNATVDHVDQGIIQIKLEAFEPGDESCCPSGVRNIALALRDLELVEIDQSAPTR